MWFQSNYDPSFLTHSLIPGHTVLIRSLHRYLNERRLGGNESQQTLSTSSGGGAYVGKRGNGDVEGHPSAAKRPRGRPKGSKNRTKDDNRIL